MGQLSALRTSKNSIPPTYRGSDDHFRPHTSYMFRGIKVCQDMFRFVHNISKNKLVSLWQHVDDSGLVERVHGNRRRMPSNTCTPIQMYIDNIGTSHAMPLPGRLPYHKDSRVILLPTDMTKARIYREYHQACIANNESPLGKSKFHHLWKEIRPYIVTMRPADDLCFDCQRMSSALSKSGHLSEEEKAITLKTYQDHLDLAKQERSAYNQQISDCREVHQELETNSESTTMHYSFDFAQQVHFPNNPLQPGPAYFLTVRKCQIFGVACEPLGW